jgi:hypothetical protein
VYGKTFLNRLTDFLWAAREILRHGEAHSIPEGCDEAPNNVSEFAKGLGDDAEGA